MAGFAAAEESSFERSSGKSGGQAEIQATLFVELLRGVQVELVERQRVAQTFPRDVAERALLPRESGGEKQRAIAANKDVFIGILRRGGRSGDEVLRWLRDGRPFWRWRELRLFGFDLLRG